MFRPRRCLQSGQPVQFTVPRAQPCTCLVWRRSGADWRPVGRKRNSNPPVSTTVRLMVFSRGGRRLCETGPGDLKVSAADGVWRPRVDQLRHFTATWPLPSAVLVLQLRNPNLRSAPRSQTSGRLSPMPGFQWFASAVEVYSVAGPLPADSPPLRNARRWRSGKQLHAEGRGMATVRVCCQKVLLTCCLCGGWLGCGGLTRTSVAGRKLDCNGVTPVASIPAAQVGRGRYLLIDGCRADPAPGAYRRLPGVPPATERDPGAV